MSSNTAFFLTSPSRALVKRRCLIKRSMVLPLQISAMTVLANQACASISPSLSDMASVDDSLHLFNAHTNETFQGAVNRKNLSHINHILRDHRQNKSTDMDRSLLQFLLAIQAAVKKPVKFKVFSGFRSAKTNAQLAASSTGVAKKSLHMQGRAIDVCIDGMSAAELAKIARQLKLGGVGCYKRSGFVHLDTGAVRHWSG